MPTLSVLQLDRFLEPGASSTTSSNNNKKIQDVEPSPNLERRNTTSLQLDDLQSYSARREDFPPPHPQLRCRNSTSSPAAVARARILPALYTTPEPTPLPDSSTSSFSLSTPYLINHKRRGPHLKSFSDQIVAAPATTADTEGGHSWSLSEEQVSIELQEGTVDDQLAVSGSNDAVLAAEVEAVEGSQVNGDCSMTENSESEDFYDPQDSMSFSGTADSEDYGVEKSAKSITPTGEFFDAWNDELSSDSGVQAQRSLNAVETELREMRLTLLMEIDKRKQAEETLQSMQQQWQILREKLGAVGLILPADFTSLTEYSQLDVGPTENICRQTEIVRFVSESMGKGIAKAEVEAYMEAQLEVKNFEIARLYDRLHYYETMNQEMSQRNQETIETARHERQKKWRRQRWLWGTLGAAAITLGTALAWSYLPGGKGSSSSNYSKPSIHGSHKK